MFQRRIYCREILFVVFPRDHPHSMYFLSLILFEKILLSISNWETFLLEKSENIIQHSNGQLDHDDAVRGVVGLTPDIKFSENAMVPMPSAAHLTLLLAQCSKNGIIVNSKTTTKLADWGMSPHDFRGWGPYRPNLLFKIH